MTSNFPGALDNFAINRIPGDVVLSATDNDQADALNKIEAELGTDPSGSSATVKARLDTLTVKPPTSRVEVYVDATAGSDANDGKSFGSAFQTIQAAITALPQGGRIWLAAGATEYIPTGTLDLSGGGYELFGCRTPGGTESIVLIRHNFNGDLLSIGDSSVTVRNVLLYASDTAQTGAAIKAVSSAAAGGDLHFDNVIVSGGVGFERNVVLDGSAWTAFGIRKATFLNCQFFGVRTAGESIVITRGVHCNFIGGFQDQARVTDGGFGLINQGIRMLDTVTTGCNFIGFRLLGDFYTEAANDLLFVGHITGNVTCAAGSSHNRFFGEIGGTFTNSGNASTNTKAAMQNGGNTWRDAQNFENGISGATGGGVTLFGNANSQTGYIQFANRFSVGVTRTEPEAGAMHTQQGVLFSERSSDPSAPATNFGMLYMKDNGAGKTQLCVRFPTGAVQVLSTEP